MNELDKQIDLIGESYKNYLTMTEPTFMGKNISLPEYIHWIKTDEKYSEKWGLKIEERELSLEERLNYGVDILGYMGMVDFGDHQTNDLLDFMGKYNIPTKLTTINYNGQIQESYE